VIDRYRAGVSARAPADLSPARMSCPRFLGGMGTVIVSTPKGVMTDRQAALIGQGGEVLCIVA